MKFNININQNELVKLSDTMDVVDAAILDYLIGMCGSTNEKIQRHRIKDDSINVYTWIDLQYLLDDMPLLRIQTKGALTRRIKRIEKSGLISILKKHINGNWRLFVKISKKTDSLIFNIGGNKEESALLENNTDQSALSVSNAGIANGQRETPFGVAQNDVNHNTSNTLSYEISGDFFKKEPLPEISTKITPDDIGLGTPGSVDIFSQAPPSRIKTKGTEMNRIIGLFALLNKDWATFLQPGAQRTSVEKLIKFAEEDGLKVEDLIEMAKELHGVQYEPQIFTPLEMVSKYNKLITSKKKNPSSQSAVPNYQYTPGKFKDIRQHKV